MSANIILVGLPGAGKSSIGELLAEKLNFHFIDTDILIEKKENSSITEIFSTKGEQYFRNVETEIISSLSNLQNTVISIGGGAFQKEENRNLLKNIGKTIYLHAEISAIYERIKTEKNRPLLNCDNPKSKLQSLYEERHAIFKTADFVIDTSSLDLNSVVENILRFINA